MNTVLCKKCEVELDENNLSKNLKLTCKKCYNDTKRIRNAIYRETHRDELREKGKIYQLSNKDKIKEYNIKNKDVIQKYNQIYNEKKSNKKYNMTEEKINEIEDLWLINFPKMKEIFFKHNNFELVYTKRLTPRLKQFYMQGYNL